VRQDLLVLLVPLVTQDQQVRQDKRERQVLWEAWGLLVVLALLGPLDQSVLWVLRDKQVQQDQLGPQAPMVSQDLQVQLEPQVLLGQLVPWDPWELLVPWE